MSPSAFNTYKNLPPVAGVATFDEAMAIGLSIDDCVARLKRHHWAFRRLNEIFVKRLISEPVYELKMGYSLHALYCAEHAAAWRKRVGEMREPPLGLEAVPDAALDALFDEILAAPSTELLIAGIYECALPALLAALQRHMRETNRLVDHPSFRICRFALIEVEEMIAYGAHCAGALIGAQDHAKMAPWKAMLNRLLAQAGGLDGASEKAAGPLEKLYSAETTHADLTPQRDERFADPYNMGVHAEVFLYDPEMPVEVKPLMMYYKRLREIDVPEVIGSIIAETKGKPWDYTVDMTRQLWDEARHAMMGEVGFRRAGIDWSKYVRINFTWSLALNTQLTALERHAVLYFIEQGLMPKTGKRFEWETAVAAGDPFSAMIQDYDWADEVLHARIGRDWYVKAMGDAKKATAYGDECWARVLIDWESYRAKGLTQHENWWPPLYKEWCRLSGRTPEEKVVAYDASYQATRADLKELSVSA